MDMKTATRDGVALRYAHADGGQGRPILLVHGWCCDHTFFAPQFEFFAKAGHTVVAPDLRGHGASDAPDGAYSMQVFSDDLLWLAGELCLERPIVIGHSMGGIVAFDLAVRHPETVAAIAMIDSAVFRPAASRANMPAFLEKLKGPAYREAVTAYVRSALFIPTDDPANEAPILARMTATPRHVMIGAFEGMRDFDPLAAGAPKMPSLFISADGKPLSDMARFLALVPDMMTGQTVGSGHFAPIEVPEQVDAMLARFVKLAG
ncbi:MAG: alpha/beta hydrolase [Rhizobiales bacterium]|nr:alpha/beta hydrolase [Hyphomicrobiales bacterium]